MLPDKKKTPEEIAALRGQLGIPETPSQPSPPEQTRANPPAIRPPYSPPAQVTPPVPSPEPSTPPPVLDPDHPDQSPEIIRQEPVMHLDPPSAPAPEKRPEAVKSHSLRKHELPLAPAPTVTQKTALPSHRHDPRDINEIRRREALAQLAQNDRQDPAAHLRKITAHPILLIPTYLLALAAALAAWQRAFYLTPLILLVIASLLTVYIFFTKKRSRHHAAILIIIIVMTLAFGGLYYAPYFSYAP